ncbi:MAG: ammonium transporter [Pseudodesulfovibrio sp.]|uniref:Ammonium transporter n=1 Tax=Pseudodesulfovibrio aespoeensis (strain ATCC 700646 / DSM 10631 / Aspo-2) TaxID=643562 RepID=E6VZG0_PSEA9|nr:MULTISPECIES: ammonium transporter [Pseudodesulfovibrio]MBU4242718.1 ammonium transporter [Pseudomonadota bacterium]ADU61674.1 ammonium transporter [Pseudodesulfovibrio aespoeensis Aspo-2]MBU4377841.1 ammonium transporter [Pseudomonadota bacterium]MBU4474097.1 ammonium transporter [Pseudomonadota bacterium]MBU4517491.1 ammonium transporter [Pseudomonadota bacterium]
MNFIDNAFILICAALVMFMTPGLALFYGGLVRSKNVLATIMQSFIMLGLVSVLWAVLGYSLSFGSDIGGLIGGLDFAFLNGVGMDNAGSPAENLPHLTFMIFQCMFAVITPALISGAFAERMKFPGFLAFSALWLLLVYAPMCHWVWGGGWLGQMGALDFAGGAVVHMSSGAAALCCALLIGKRKGHGSQPFIPHNLPMTILGAGILWFGWFGFNAGSALAADGLAANAFVTTHMATAAAAMSWIAAEWLHGGKPTTLGAASGAVAGLVAITPAAGFVTPMAAIVLGLGAGIICYGGIMLKNKLGYDDALDVVGIHGVGGTYGALATGVLASIGAEGLLLGNGHQLWVQFVSVIATWGFCFAMTFIIFKVVDATIGLKAGDEAQDRGMDIAEHSETGYQW